MSVLALVLIAPAVALTLPLALSKRGLGPEGPVGAHMVTIPLALLGAAGLAILIGKGLWACFPYARTLAAGLLCGYVALMTLLPILALRPGLARAACLLILAAELAAGVAGVMDVAPGPLRMSSGLVLAAAGLGGWGVLGAWAVAAAANAARAAEADARRMDAFEREQAAFEAGEWAKLPPSPGLWQLIQFVDSRNPDVRAACRAAIAARPTLEAELIELLGSGWAKYGADYIVDLYERPPAPLAPAYGKFLEASLREWESTLAQHPNPGIWEPNLNPLLDAAVKIARGGGDLREPLRAWAALLERTRGLEGLAARLQAVLRA
jgi:hypothetical protein